ncbi:hypothetical protein HMI55_001293 [Coelomomyces lativittatus]|nr:hypothetical protein HMI55_001293 [Coelomomyces lativittatus]
MASILTKKYSNCAYIDDTLFSVGYNLISSQYLGGPRGEKQKSLDNLALLKFERREKEIFAKSNSFDPIQNIPCKSPSELQLLSIKDNGIRVIIKPKA